VKAGLAAESGAGTPDHSPTGALSASEVDRGLRVSIVEGGFAMVYATLGGGMFLTGLALWLGANSFQIALITAIPPLVTVFSFLSGDLARRVGSRKRLLIWTAGIGRAVLLVLVPFLLLQMKVSLTLFFTTVVLASLIMTVAGTVWQSWISDLVPEERRGRFFGMRNAIHGVIGVCTAYAAGRGMDWLKAQGHEAVGYGLAFGLAVLFGAVSTLLLFRQPELKSRRRPPLSLRLTLLGPLKEPEFRKLIIFLAVWFVTSAVAAPFYLVHMMTNLKFSFAAIGVYSMVGGAIGMLFQVLWGKAVDRFGSRPVTVVNFAFVGLCPLLWLFSSRSFPHPVWADALLNGVVWTGASLGLWNLLLDLAEDPSHRESYFAIYSVVTGLCAFVASLLAGVIAQALHNFRLTLFGFEFVNYSVLFLVAGIARFATLPLLLRVQERGSKSVRHTVRAVSALGVWRINRGRGMLLDALGLRSRGQL